MDDGQLPRFGMDDGQDDVVVARGFGGAQMEGRCADGLSCGSFGRATGFIVVLFLVGRLCSVASVGIISSWFLVVADGGVGSLGCERGGLFVCEGYGVGAEGVRVGSFVEEEKG